MPRKVVYFARAGSTDRVKIGYTSSLNKRIQSLQTGCPEPLEVILIIHDGSRRLESYLHTKFERNRINGEWFRFCKGMASYVNKVLENQEIEAEKYWEKKEQDYWDSKQAKWEAEQDAQEDC